ncbi:MAG TPA: CRISPR-associated endonuclease Cas1 [Bacteroidales bacterium]|nr:CRISPR-associated endonuclease Cas1 [Bacteroidales bacterium]HQB20436.1 CRISPR-associated endonuclease Cas1 [Bacteroidales bacterium]
MELILNTYGTSLSRDNEGFVILHKDGKQRIPAQGIEAIIISKGAQITSDAVILAIENEIEVLFMDKTGNPIGRVWSPKYGSISTIRKGQLNFTFSKEAVSWIVEVITQKIENQQALLLSLYCDNELQKRTIEKAIRRLEDYRKKISLVEGETISDVAPTLRGWEGIASKIYFECIGSFMPDNLQFQKRSQHPATDVVNSMLNYGYGILYGKIEGVLIKTGIDPYIGVMHRDDYNRPVLVYDIIELYRIWVDYVVLTLAMQNAITDEYYSVKEDGSYWLEPLGRRVIIQSINDYLDETINLKGITRSRQHHLFLYAQSLAQTFKKFEK